jgi:hypothetical protein
MLLDAVAHTLMNNSKLSIDFIEKVKFRTGNYQMHLLNNLGHGRILCIGAYGDRQVISFLVGNTVSIDCVMTDKRGTDCDVFKNLVHKYQNANSSVNYYTDLTNIKFSDYDIIYMGQYAPDSIFSEYVSQLKLSCIVLLDFWQSRQLGIGCMEMYSIYPAEEFVNRKLLQYNESTWWNGMGIYCHDIMQHPDVQRLCGIISNTLQCSSKISTPVVKTILNRNGVYQFHLLSNAVYRTGMKMLCLASFGDFQIIASLVNTDIEMDCVLRKCKPEADIVFKSKVKSHKTIDSSIKYLEKQEILNCLPEPIYDIIYIGFGGEYDNFELLIPLLKSGCILIIDNWQTVGYMFEQILKAIPIRYYQIFYARWLMDRYVDTKVLQFNTSTWNDGIYIAVLE